MCYTRNKDEHDLEREARWVTEVRLMEEEARQRHEDHQRRRRRAQEEEEEEKKPLTEKVKEMVGTGS
jgi:hypothetical protein